MSAASISSTVNRPIEADQDAPAVEPVVVVQGSLVDSWLEPAGSCDWNSQVVLQITPRRRARDPVRHPDLMILEAPASMVPDRGWLTDLAENMCNGCLVWVRARPLPSGLYEALALELER